MDISRTHLIEDLNSSMEGDDILFGGWVVDLRKLGKMAFLTVRDVTGTVSYTHLTLPTSDVV